jgi:hypothetical protein
MRYNYQFPPILLLKNRHSAVFPRNILKYKISKIDLLKHLVSIHKHWHLIILLRIILLLVHVYKLCFPLWLQTIASKVLYFNSFSFLRYPQTQPIAKGKDKPWTNTHSIELNGFFHFFTCNCRLWAAHYCVQCLCCHFEMLVLLIHKINLHAVHDELFVHLHLLHLQDGYTITVVRLQ